MINAPKKEKKNHSWPFILFRADSTLAGVVWADSLVLPSHPTANPKVVDLLWKAGGHAVITPFARPCLPCDKWAVWNDISPSPNTCMEKAKRLTDGRQSLQTTAFPLIWWNIKSRANQCLYQLPETALLQFQAPRMINDLANPAGRPTQTRMELIAVRKTLAWRQRKCRWALANRKKKKRSQLLLWTPSWLLLTRVASSVHKSQRAYSWDCP